MHSDKIGDQIRKIKQELIRTQVLFERKERLGSCHAMTLRHIGAPEELVAQIEREDRQNRRNAYIVARATLLISLALHTGAPQDLDNIFELFHPRTAQS